jgi:hypothetical protein
MMLYCPLWMEGRVCEIVIYLGNYETTGRFLFVPASDFLPCVRKTELQVRP